MFLTLYSWQRIKEAPSNIQTSQISTLLDLALHIQLFRERLSEIVHATITKDIVCGFEFAVLFKEISKNGKRGH